MLLHVPAGGGPTVLVSVPRDSYVAIPGHGKNKINAAYAFGGPQLLVRTVEQATGLRIDELRRDRSGRVRHARRRDRRRRRLRRSAPMKDAKAHIDVKAGCQTFDGATALGYARARYSDPRGDLGRVERQRQVLAAIAGKTLSPSVIAARPWRAFPAASAGGDALTVDAGTSPLGLLAVRAGDARRGRRRRAVADRPGREPALQTPSRRGGGVGQPPRPPSCSTALRADDTNAIQPLADAQKKAAG